MVGAGQSVLLPVVHLQEFQFWARLLQRKGLWTWIVLFQHHTDRKASSPQQRVVLGYLKCYSL